MYEMSSGDAGRTSKFFDEEFTLPCYITNGNVYCLEE